MDFVNQKMFMSKHDIHEYKNASVVMVDTFVPN